MTYQPSAEIKKQVTDYLEKEVHTPVSQMCEELSLTEAQVTFALPAEMVTAAKGELAETILAVLPSWGKVTTIVNSGGSVFEVKADFPKGKVMHGFYNLMGRDGQLHGHLRTDLITDIAFVSKPFRGSESHYIGFFTAAGLCMFKVYLGRDKKRQLIPEQIELFHAMKQELAA